MRWSFRGGTGTTSPLCVASLSVAWAETAESDTNMTANRLPKPAAALGVLRNRRHAFSPGRAPKAGVEHRGSARGGRTAGRRQRHVVWTRRRGAPPDEVLPRPKDGDGREGPCFFTWKRPTPIKSAPPSPVVLPALQRVLDAAGEHRLPEGGPTGDIAG